MIVPPGQNKGGHGDDTDRLGFHLLASNPGNQGQNTIDIFKCINLGVCGVVVVSFSLINSED